MNILRSEKFKVGADNCKREEEGLGLSPKGKRRKNDTLGGRIMRSTGTKDRHSKVCTARGPRDRRLRLSPKTAISFYDVQERLGYDRPSKAIDWLMKEAKSAIDALDQPPQIRIITDHQDPLSSFGFFTHASTSEERLSSATPPEIFDTNLEIARLHTNLSWNCVSPPPPPLHLGYGYTFTDREPLQSRISPQFPSVNFSNDELLNFTTFKEDDMDINSSFLH